MAIPDLTSSTYLITGANSGLGLETARKLARAGGHVVLAVRDTERGRRAAAQVGGSTEVAELDLADLASVEAFADGWDRELTTLVNNAGIMMVPQGRTADGFERQMGTNHLGHFALTMRLLPHVTDRVVTISSALHNGPQLDPVALDFAEGYGPSRAYQRSKLANLLFTAELQRRLAAAGSSVRAMAAHPGYSATGLQGHHANPLIGRLLGIGNRIIATSAEFGSRPTVEAIVGDHPGDTFIGPTKLFGTRGAPGRVSRSDAARDDAVAARLWEVSQERTGVSFPL